MSTTKLVPKSSNHDTVSVAEDQGGRASKRQRIDRQGNESHVKNSIKRISRACDVCRLKKNRCDGERPTCHQCSTGGLECTYGAQIRKRGLPTGYVRVLEALWAITLKLVPNSEETALALLKSVYVRYDEEEKVIFESDRLSPDEPLRGIWAKSQLRQRIDQVVGQFENGPEAGLFGQHQDTLLRSSMSSLDDRIVMPFQPWRLPASPATQRSQPPLNERTAPRDLSIGTVCHHREDLPKTMSWGQLTPLIDSHQALSALSETAVRKSSSRPHYRMPENTWALIDTYFNFTHCWFPIVHKHTVMKIASSQQDGGDGDAGEIALLFAVLALSSTHTSQTNDELNPSELQSHYQVSSNLLTYNEGACKLGQIQALLLLSMTDMARGDWETASILVGRATRMILLWRNGKPQRAATEAESGLFALAKRVTLGSFTLDTIIATHLQSLPHLRTQDVQGFLDFDEDGPDEWEQWVKKAQPGSTAWPTQGLSHQQAPIRALSTFKEYASLLSVLNDAICKCFGEPVVAQADQEDIMTKLDSWILNLSRHNKLWIQGTSQAYNESPPPTANLHLTYSIVLLYLRLLTSSTNHTIPLISSSKISNMCDATFTSYKEAFGHYQWQAIVQLLIRLRSHPHTADEMDCYTNDQKDYLASTTTRRAASSILQLPSDTQIISSQPSLGEMDMLATGANFEQEADAVSRLALAMEDGLCRGMQRGMMQVKPLPTVIDPPEFSEGGVGDDLPRCHDNPDDMSVDMAISMTPFNNFQDAGTIESLLEELSSANKNDWAMTPSQFMYNLGFYDGEPDG